MLATGAGSLILSHVNDAGFWLVKQYFNMTVAETFKTWTAMETILSVVGLLLNRGVMMIRKRVLFWDPSEKERIDQERVSA